MKTKKEKINFILSYRHDEIKSNHSFYKYLKREYLKMDDEEVNIEFNFYNKQETEKVKNV